MKNNKTKSLIIDVALPIFIEKGYHHTSIRHILKEANVTTGSFYHYFDSKEELFKEVVEKFLYLYEKKTSYILLDPTLSLNDKIQQLIQLLFNQLDMYYHQLNANEMHQTIQMTLHQNTLAQILPSIEVAIDEAIKRNEVQNLSHLDTHTLSIVILKGIEGIVHSGDSQELISMKIQAYLNCLLK